MLQSVDQSTLLSPDTAETVSVAMDTTRAVVQANFQPVNFIGDPLEGPMQLFSGNVAKAAAQADYGYTLQLTPNYLEALAADAEVRLALGIPAPAYYPVDIYLQTWGPPSGQASSTQCSAGTT